MRAVANFGGNICFRPRCLYAPRTDDEVLRILNDHRDGAIRVVGAGHSWNPGIESTDVLIDMKHICHVHVNEKRTRVTAGAGVRIGALLKHLSRRELTLPSLGLIDRQTIAGAVATGTHGSGRHSMSHYVEAMRIACYGADGAATVRTVDSGTPLRAARCSVGALGVVLEVTLPCVPQYHVRERCRWKPGLGAVLAGEAGGADAAVLPHAARVDVSGARAQHGEREPAGGGRGAVPRVLADSDRHAAAPLREVLRVADAEPAAGSPIVSAPFACVHLPPLAGHRPQRPGSC